MAINSNSIGGEAVLPIALGFAKSYTDQQVSKVRNKFQVVASVSDLPDPGDANTIYLVPKGTDNVYDQYIYDTETGSYVDIGDTTIDLDEYVTDAEMQGALSPIIDITGNFVVENGKLCIIVSDGNNNNANTNEALALDSTLQDLVDAVEDIADNVAEVSAASAAQAATDWMDEHLDPQTAPIVIDSSLTTQGAAADAKAAGDAISDLNSALNDLMSYVNRIDTAVNVYQNTSISTTTGAKTTGQTGKTLYVIPVTASEILYFTQCSSSIMLIGLYSDATATTFIDFAYNEGLTGWNKYLTVPSGTSYLGIVVTTAYADTAFCGAYSDYLIFADHNKTKLSNDVYIAKLESLKNNFDDEMDKVSISQNLFDYDTLSEWGYWCNYVNGQIQSTQYTVTDAYSGYIKVKPSTDYARRCGNIGTVFFDEHKTFISGVTTNNFTTPANCAYLIMNLSYNDALCQYEMLLEQDDVIAQSDNFIPYYNDYTKHSPNFVTVGTNGDFQTILEGFRHAIARDCACVIMPGTYNLVAEGISGKGYYLPKEVYGYGATLTCNLSEEDWDLSPLNVSVKSKGAKVYGLTVICTNCRYCIHDDMGSVTQPNYHNVFKDLHLIHNSAQSEVLLAPQCIGGGFGSNGFIEIDGCVFEATMRDVSYHSNPGQNKNATLWCKNSVFSHTYTSTNSGTASVMNTSYVTGCLMASLPSTTPTVNTRIIEWNNDLVS